MDAVDAERLRDLLNILGVRRSFENGEHRCEICGDIITYENTKFILPKPNRTVGFVCKKASCVVEFTLSQELERQET